MVYGHANGRDLEETSDQVAEYIDQGYLAVRAQSGVPGLPSTYGVPKIRRLTNQPRKACPRRARGQQRSISITFPSSLRRCVPGSGTMSTFCTMRIIDLRRSRRLVSEMRLKPTICFGWKMR